MIVIRQTTPKSIADSHMHFWIMALTNTLTDTTTRQTGDCNKLTVMANNWWDFSSQTNFIILLEKMPLGKLINWPWLVRII